MRKKPFFVAAGIGVVVICVFSFPVYRRMARQQEQTQTEMKPWIDKLQKQSDYYKEKAREAGGASDLKGSSGNASGSVDAKP